MDGGDDKMGRQRRGGGCNGVMAAPAAAAAGTQALLTTVDLGITSVLLAARTDSRIVSRSNSRMKLETEGVIEEEEEEGEAAGIQALLATADFAITSVRLAAPSDSGFVSCSNSRIASASRSLGPANEGFQFPSDSEKYAVLLTTALANVEFDLSGQGIPLLFFLAIVHSPYCLHSSSVRPRCLKRPFRHSNPRCDKHKDSLSISV
jgi:hypothetical protein